MPLTHIEIASHIADDKHTKTRSVADRQACQRSRDIAGRLRDCN